MRSSLAILKTIVTLTPTETPMDVPGSRTEVSGRRVKFPRILWNRTAAWFEMNIGCECSGQQPETQCCTFCSAAGWQANDSAHHVMSACCLITESHQWWHGARRGPGYHHQGEVRRPLQPLLSDWLPMGAVVADTHRWPTYTQIGYVLFSCSRNTWAWAEVLHILRQP